MSDTGTADDEGRDQAEQPDLADRPDEQDQPDEVADLEGAAQEMSGEAGETERSLEKEGYASPDGPDPVTRI